MNLAIDDLFWNAVTQNAENGGSPHFGQFQPCQVGASGKEIITRRFQRIRKGHRAESGTVLEGIGFNGMKILSIVQLQQGFAL